MTASPFDTVAAVSTPYGRGGVAVIRISGEDAVAVAERMFRPADGRPLGAHPARTAVYGEIHDPGHPCVLDDGLCTVFRAPHSFTGENTVEISCHGGILVTRRVLEACFLAGARQALPGEFTRRAFLNGKLALERAEALGNLLDAGNEEQMKLARAGMNGLLTDRAEAIYASLCGVLANMEAGMDFPEEDLTELSREQLQELCTNAGEDISALIRTWRTGHAIAEGIPTVICGRPNVGKSAFYNRLVGRDAAIVTDIAGTTRDVLTDTATLGRVTLRLSDTAGLRESDDPVERIGVERARRAMDEAELVLLLSDTDRDPEADALCETLSGQGKTVLRIRTKSDLCAPAIPNSEFSVPPVLPVSAENPEQATATPSAIPHSEFRIPHSPPLPLSSVTGDGFDRLTAAVEAAFIDGDLRMGEDAVVFSARQVAALREAADALATAVENLTAAVPYDICADDLRAALAALGSLCGRETGEDVITEIFARFCVGK